MVHILTLPGFKATYMPAYYVFVHGVCTNKYIERLKIDGEFKTKAHDADRFFRSTSRFGNPTLLRPIINIRFY